MHLPYLRVVMCAYQLKRLYAHHDQHTAGMARLNMVVDDDLEAKFRDAVYRRLGMKKGNIQNASHAPRVNSENSERNEQKN